MDITTLAACQQRATPLSLDRKMFQPLLGVVTWHALRLVVKHCDSMKLPLKPCTGTFTRSMGLPCAHICDEKKDLGGLSIEDFDPHWFWDRTNVHIPLREPQQARRIPNNLPQASTGRTLSSFETPTRTPPMCSVCHQRGHTMRSQNCPERLRASIARSSQALRENELLQASQASNISQLSVRFSTPPASQPSEHIIPSSERFRALDPERPENASESLFADPQHTLIIQPTTPNPKRGIFHQLFNGVFNLGRSTIPDSEDSMSSSSTP
jgi:hypothetical protein